MNGLKATCLCGLVAAFMGSPSMNLVRAAVVQRDGRKGLSISRRNGGGELVLVPAALGQRQPAPGRIDLEESELDEVAVSHACCLRPETDCRSRR